MDSRRHKNGPAIGVVAILAGFAGLTLAGLAGFTGAMPGLSAGAGIVVLVAMSLIAIGGGIWELSRMSGE